MTLLYHDGSLKAYCEHWMSVNQGGTFLANFPRNYFLNSCLSKNILKERELKTSFILSNIYRLILNTEKCLSHDRGIWQWEFWEWVIKIRGLLFIVHATLGTMNWPFIMSGDILIMLASAEAIKLWFTGSSFIDAHNQILISRINCSVDRQTSLTSTSINSYYVEQLRGSKSGW